MRKVISIIDRNWLKSLVFVTLYSDLIRQTDARQILWRLMVMRGFILFFFFLQIPCLMSIDFFMLYQFNILLIDSHHNM